MINTKKLKRLDRKYKALSKIFGGSCYKVGEIHLKPVSTFMSA